MAKKTTSPEASLPSLALVFGYIAVKELGRLEDKIAVLTRLGYGNEEMAKICDSTPGAVKTLKSSIKKNRGNKK